MKKEVKNFYTLNEREANGIKRCLKYCLHRWEKHPTSGIHKAIGLATLNQLAKWLPDTDERLPDTTKTMEVLERIEEIVNDDFMTDMQLKESGELSCEASLMLIKLLKVYRLAHSFNKNHSCHDVHKNWREEL